MDADTVHEVLVQAGKALIYYGVLLLMIRLAGKRLAGQTTTFDLLVLISLGVSVQSALLGKTALDVAVFVVVVFAVHRSVAALCRHSPAVRHLLRGKPRALVLDGVVLDAALAAENVSHEELLAGLRRLGFAHPREVRLAVLEETGHISAVGAERADAASAAADETRL